MTPSIAISSLHWDESVLLGGLKKASEFGVKKLELAPYSVFQSWQPSADSLKSFKQQLQDYDFSVVSMQGIFYFQNKYQLREVFTDSQRWSEHFYRLAEIMPEHCRRLLAWHAS